MVPTAEAKVLEDLKPGDILAWVPSRTKGKAAPKPPRGASKSKGKAKMQSRSSSPEALIKTVQKNARSSLRNKR